MPDTESVRLPEQNGPDGPMPMAADPSVSGLRGLVARATNQQLQQVNSNGGYYMEVGPDIMGDFEDK